jgi:catechol 2,3-dioxygenase-like lactoylglutathione lyase family enzyme
MSRTQLSNDAATEASAVATAPARFEVTTLPVADVDRAKAFYQRLGWRLDIDFKPSPETRGVRGGHDDDGARLAAGPDPRRRRHRGRP